MEDWFIGNGREMGEDRGVLGVLRTPNTPIFIAHPGDSQRTGRFVTGGN